jgi:hypothetical protein
MNNIPPGVTDPAFKRPWCGNGKKKKKAEEEIKGPRTRREWCEFRDEYIEVECE